MKFSYTCDLCGYSRILEGNITWDECPKCAGKRFNVKRIDKLSVGSQILEKGENE